MGENSLERAKGAKNTCYCQIFSKTCNCAFLLKILVTMTFKVFLGILFSLLN
jgi:hypothetical protein